MLTVGNNYTVIQITDTHLFSDKSTELLGYCTHKYLTDTIDHVLKSRTKPNIVLITGDISQDETAQSYKLALEQFERLDCLVYWIHGNHDNEIELKPIFNNSPKLKKLDKLSVPFWDFISINTCRYGTEKGYIEDDEYERFLLKIEETKKKNKKIAVVMHHHPIPVDTPLLDECMLENHDKFLRVAKQNKEIKLIICGHVHGNYRIVHDELVMESCPATCFQWKKGASEDETENRRGYKIFNFNADAYTSSTIFI